MIVILDHYIIRKYFESRLENVAIGPLVWTRMVRNGSRTAFSLEEILFSSFKGKAHTLGQTQLGNT